MTASRHDRPRHEVVLHSRKIGVFAIFCGISCLQVVGGVKKSWIAEINGPLGKILQPSRSRPDRERHREGRESCRWGNTPPVPTESAGKESWWPWPLDKSAPLSQGTAIPMV
jgi:hypothetical protein